MSAFVWQREMLHLMAALMEIVWCTLLFIALAPGANALPTVSVALFVLVNLLASMGLVRYLTLQLVPFVVMRWIVLAGLAAAIALTLAVILPPTVAGSGRSLMLSAFSTTAPILAPPAIMTGALITFLWFRGIRIATTLITPVRAAFGFRAGILILIVLAIVPDTRFQATLVSMLPLFFFSGLMSNTLARTASLKLNRDRLSFGKQWLGFTGGSGVLVWGSGLLSA